MKRRRYRKEREREREKKKKFGSLLIKPVPQTNQALN
jgi:hypothetical protein